PRLELAGGNLSGLPQTLSTDHDDDDGRNARGLAAGGGVWRGLRVAPPARHIHRRRAHRQPIADALHDPGHLSLSRSFPLVDAAALATSPSAVLPGPHPRTGGMKPPEMERTAPLPHRGRGAVWVSGVALLLSAYAVGPDYRRPSASIPTQYKEAGWKLGEPLDAIDRGTWWSMYNDPMLDGLERQIDISNQNLLAAEAAFRQAEFVVAQARAQFFPTATVNASAQ